MQGDGKSGAAIPAVAFHREGAAMGRDHRLGNRQPEAEPAEAAGDRALALLEGVEDFADLLRLDADAGVGGPDLDLSPAWG